MAEVVREILLCLSVAALLGCAIGWLARGLLERRPAAAEAAQFRRATEELGNQLRAAEAARAGEQRRLEELHVAVDTARQQAEVLRRELKETEMARDTARHDILGTRDQFTKLSAHLADAESTRDAAKTEADTARAALAVVRAQRDPPTARAVGGGSQRAHGATRRLRSAACRPADQSRYGASAHHRPVGGSGRAG